MTENCTVGPYYIHPVTPVWPPSYPAWYYTTYPPAKTTDSSNITFATEPQQGWECPNCKTIYAPWVPSCNCETEDSE